MTRDCPRHVTKQEPATSTATLTKSLMTIPAARMARKKRKMASRERRRRVRLLTPSPPMRSYEPPSLWTCPVPCSSPAGKRHKYMRTRPLTDPGEVQIHNVWQEQETHWFSRWALTDPWNLCRFRLGPAPAERTIERFLCIPCGCPSVPFHVRCQENKF